MTMNDYAAKKRYQDETEASSYDQARFTSLKGRIMDRLEKRSVIKALELIGEIETAMDIPCGTGRITELLVDRAQNVIGADISEEMMGMAKRKLRNNPHVSFFKIDAENMELDDSSIDCITCVRLMGHIPPENRIKMLREMARVSKKWVVPTFYKSGLLTKLKRTVKIALTGNKAPWFPANHKNILKEIDAAGLKLVDKFPVLPGVSQAVTYLLKKK